MGPRKYRKAYVMPNTFAALWWNLLWLLARKGLNGPMRPVDDALRTLSAEAASWDVFDRANYFLPAIQQISPFVDTED